LFSPEVCITWENCSNIEISLISFIILGEFTFSIIFKHSYLVQLSDISVYGNEENVGCSSILSQYSTLHIQDSKFAGIQGSFGAAIMISRSCVIFTGNNLLSNNSAPYGGSLYILESVVTLRGINTFMNNTSPEYTRSFDFRIECSEDDEYDWYRGSGGAIYCSSSTLDINSEYSIFAKNFVYGYGGAIHARDGKIITKGSITFMKNIAQHNGGAIFLSSVTLIVSGNVSFINNKADFGGALSISRTNFLIVCEEKMANENYIFNDRTRFCRNVAMNGDIEAERTYVRVLDRYNGKFNESGKGVAVFHGNVATTAGGGIEGDDDSDIIVVDGNISFENNTAMNGGGMHLGDNSKLIVSSLIENDVSFVFNHAHRFGGALYIDDSHCTTHSRVCFLSIYGYTTELVLILFLNNSAGSKGSTLYGGQLNKCGLCFKADVKIDKCDKRADIDDALEIFMEISRISDSESASSIASQPEQLKFCQLEGETITMDDLPLDLAVHPGEEFNISVIALDQTDFPVPATIFIEKSYDHYDNYYERLMDEGDKYRLSPSRQSIKLNDPFCTNLTYKLYSAHEYVQVHFQLYYENPCQNIVDGLDLNIFIESCPFGFELSENQKCQCHKRLLKFTHKCSIGKSTAIFVREKNNFWISQVDFDVLVIHEFRCPLDYCKDIPEDVSLSDPSVQCDFNRTGVVCGQCRKNFSLALGSLHCIPCNNKYTALTLFFMMAGVALIVIIFLFRLIISVGTLSGLFFYANIIQANHQAYFPRATMNFFTIFVSWLNLDLGIETCFYDGMNIYAYSWFQFLFPFYVWFLVGCIILACRYSQSFAKRLGQNPVAVLATLLLMSYSKIFSGVIVPLTWTYLTYYTISNETQSVVWMYDASMQYFGEPKHIALGLFATLCVAVFVLPYLLLLFFGHWLQGCSNWWILSWLNKIKPFMDAYHAPYRKHTRYWTGLLLITRLGLFLTFAINANGSEGVNLLAVSSVSISLLAIHRRVYEKTWKDFLESSYILNLGIFSVATFYLKEESKNDNNQLILSSISIGIAFITFLGILLFHISLVFKSSNIWKEHMIPFIQKSRFLSMILGVTVIKDNATVRNVEATVLHALPTTTEVAIDLNKPLLLEISTDAATYD
jgi:predicted outer membrane repeat protein